MLFNKDWNKTKTDPMSLDNLIAWLETKHPTQRYDFCDASRCLMAQWAQSIDPAARSVQDRTGNSWAYLINGQVVNFQRTVMSGVVRTANHTFGEALGKAKEYRRQGNA